MKVLLATPATADVDAADDEGTIIGYLSQYNKINEQARRVSAAAAPTSSIEISASASPVATAPARREESSPPMPRTRILSFTKPKRDGEELHNPRETKRQRSASVDQNSYHSRIKGTPPLRGL